MKQLYQVLLRDVEVRTQGANMSYIVPLLDKRGEKMGTQKLVIIIDGSKYKPIDYAQLNFSVEDDTMTLDIYTTSAKETENTVEPATKGFAIVNETKEFLLTGEDFDAFKDLSEFRLADNTTGSIPTIPAESIIIESGEYNIQDMASIQNAIFDLVEKEKGFLDQGYKVNKVEIPKYLYSDPEDPDYFKLTETATLYKVSTPDATQ